MTENNTSSSGVMDDLQGAFGHLKLSLIIPAILLVAIIIYVLTGIYIVNPGEQAVVKRFGRVIDVTGEGAHYRLPWPIDSVAVVKVGEVRRADIGLVLPEHKHVAFLPEKLQIMTGDENIINVEAIVHYKIKDASRFLYQVNFSEERLLHNAVGAALVNLIGQMSVDDILTTEKVSAQAKILWEAQKVLDKYESGLQIMSFNIQAVIPPENVADAFRDVQTARVDREQVINQAKGYANSVIPAARGKASEMLRSAESFKIEAVNRATGDAQSFNAILGEYQKNSKMFTADVTRYRLYLETMEKVMPRIKKYVVNSSSGKDDKINMRFINRK